MEQGWEFEVGAGAPGPPELVVAIWRRYAAGLSRAAVGAEFGVSESAVARALGSWGYPVRRRGQPMQDARAEAMWDRYCAGLSLAAVGAEFGVSWSAVARMFARRGWARRQSGRRKDE